MVLDQTQRESFEQVVKPVIEWLNNNAHPHASVVIDSGHAELLEGVAVVRTEEFIKG